jgi:hypothetical protein
MLTKKKILESIKAMPENSFEDIDVLLERIVLLEKIEEAEKAIKEGRVYTQKEAMQKMKKWLQ